MALKNLTQPEYLPEPSPNADGLQGLYSMVHGFLGVVQPKPFPAETLTKVIQGKVQNMESEGYKNMVSYEVGFLVCAAIGLLFILLVPLVGLFFCCCRCCGRCGGTMYQEQTKHTRCRRRALFTAMLGVSTILLAGNICAFVSNSRMSQAVSGGFSAFNSTLDNLHTYLKAIPQEIDFVLDASAEPVSQANNSLMRIGPLLGGRIMAELGGKAYGALDSASQLLTAASNVEDGLRALEQTGQQLQELQKELRQNLTRVRNSINQTLQECGDPCQNVTVEGLELGANFSVVPDVRRPLELLGNLTQLDANGTIAQANKTLNEMPEKVAEQAQDVVSDAQKQLGRVRQEIATVRSKFSVLDRLQNVSEMLDSISVKAGGYKPQVTTYDRYRWIAGIVLCCLVLLVVVCNGLGLALGALGLDPQALPVRRGCLSNAGGDFLMAGVGFSFLFSWLLMLLVLVVFLVGGNAYCLVCRPWADGQLLRFLDTPGLIPNFNLSQMLGMPDANLTLTGIYSNCRHNAPLWSTLHLDQLIPLDETLNISKYTGDVSAALDKLNVNVSAVTLLSDKQRDLLRDLGAGGLQNLDFSGVLEQIGKNPIKQDLQVLVRKLEDLANKTQNESRRTELRNEVSDLKHIQDQVDTRFLPEIKALNRSLQLLRVVVPRISSLVSATLARVEAAQSFLAQNVSKIIKNETQDFVHTLLGFFELYLAWAKQTVTREVARCGPMAWTMDGARTILCAYVVNSLNAFWFSLGWCTVFLLPNIVLAVRLAKFYRRMHVADTYEDDDDMMELSQAPNGFPIPRAELKK